MWVQGPWVQVEICRNISFCSFSMGPKGMKYQEIKKSNCVWSRNSIKKAFSQFFGRPHIVKICGSICGSRSNF